MKWLLALALLAVAILPADAKPIALRIHEAVEEVCPIDGISIEDAKDKKTWRIDFRSTATDEQKKAARQVVKDFDPNGEDPKEVSKKAASNRLKNAIRGDDQAELFSALKEALKEGALKVEE